ncbi:hypothetical protein [Acutalibacter caecimuris]|uniref:hypothetical protein n=1 Tax=Acutalibacter caecimuris TaxID=3093657 RepID=UPI002AC92365|nr:hypothetical protein [Acutalibacter sp. M00118]
MYVLAETCRMKAASGGQGNFLKKVRLAKGKPSAPLQKLPIPCTGDGFPCAWRPAAVAFYGFWAGFVFSIFFCFLFLFFLSFLFLIFIFIAFIFAFWGIAGLWPG